MGRVAVWAWLLALCLAPPLAAAPRFGFQDLYASARERAGRPYEPPKDHVAAPWTGLTYQQYQDIRFNPLRALWRAAGLPFQVQFFPAGYLFTHPVRINVIDDTGVHRVRFAPDLYTVARAHLPEPLPAALGFAGFRLHYPINQLSRADEFVVFLGASYFRAVGRAEAYGLSARGLALNTAERGGEEFPSFVEFWLSTPDRSARTATVYALLDGPSAAGAYQFDITPGPQTRVAVTAAVFFRSRVGVLGVAPLSSMFFHGDTAAQAFGDFRPAVHDSDGLLLASRTGEWLWRPLVNPRTVAVSSFTLDDPKGFGLMQRDRAFDHYQDLGARFDLRPSAWVVPDQPWGAGQVRLIEFPSDQEYADNVVAMWVPARQPAPGTPLRLAYHIVWGDEEAALPPPPAGRVVGTRIGTLRAVDGWSGPPAQIVVIDFAGRTLDALPGGAPVEAVVSAGPGVRIAKTHVEKNPLAGGWRVSFHAQYISNSPAELRCFLKRGADALTETWSYLGQP